MAISNNQFRLYFEGLCSKLGIAMDPRREKQLSSWFKDIPPEMDEDGLIETFRRLQTTDFAFPRYSQWREALGGARKARPQVTSDCLRCRGYGTVSVYRHPAGYYYHHEAMEFENFHPNNGESLACACEAGDRFGTVKKWRPEMMAQDSDLGDPTASTMTTDEASALLKGTKLAALPF